MKSLHLNLPTLVIVSLTVMGGLQANSVQRNTAIPLAQESQELRVQSSPTATSTSFFPDITGDIYATQIVRAVNIGFITGFPDGKFYPTKPVTREELASMIADAIIIRAPGGLATLPPVSSDPFQDVTANRWSAAKIQFLKDQGVLSGDPIGTFRPTDNITRAELVAAIRRVSELFVTKTRPGIPLDTVIVPPTPQNSFAFSDISDHWAEEAILTMSVSTNCKVATPLNETGTAFKPNQAALRNYAATTIVRTLDCGITK